MHYILVQNNTKGETFIPAKFVQPFFRGQKGILIYLYGILYDHKFIKRVVLKQGKSGLNYYKVTINKCTLTSFDLPIPLRYQYLNYVHLLDPNENLKLQNVLNYTIDIDYDTLDIELNKWKIKKLSEHNVEKDISTTELFNKIQSHNDKINNDIKSWSKDEYSGRRHHLLSYSPSFLRNYTNHGKLIENDVTQCQPVLLALLEERYNKIDNDYSKLFYDKDFDVYNYISKDREEGKNTFYKMFFGYSENDKLFKKLFPNYSDRLDKIKKEDPSLIGILESDNNLAIKDDNKKAKWIRKNFKYYKAVSLACTKLEVEIFEKIWKELLKKKLFFIPIHDGIYCYEKDVLKVQNIMKKGFEDEFGNTQIKIKLK